MIGFLVFLLVVAAWWIPGLFTSRSVYRKYPEEFDLSDPGDLVLLLIVACVWPLYPGWLLLRRFYEGSDDN